MPEIRAARLHDLPAVYRICFDTADRDWDPATTPHDPDLLGHLYAGPYLLFQRELASVVVDDAGVAGYILGCADTADWQQRLERDWWPGLRSAHPVSGAAPVDAALVRGIHDGDPDPVLPGFPAHLHIDLLPRAQGRGYGRMLLQRLLDQLRDRGVPGVHLGVGDANRNAIAFYEHLGFGTALVDEGTRWMTRAL